MIFVLEKIINQLQADFGKGRYLKQENDPAKA